MNGIDTHVFNSQKVNTVSTILHIKYDMLQVEWFLDLLSTSL